MDRCRGVVYGRSGPSLDGMRMDDTPAGLVRWLFAAAGDGRETGPLPMRVGPVTLHDSVGSRVTDGRALQELIEPYREGFSDLRFHVEDLLEQGDLMAARCRVIGTHRGLP